MTLMEMYQDEVIAVAALHIMEKSTIAFGTIFVLSKCPSSTSFYEKTREVGEVTADRSAITYEGRSKSFYIFIGDGEGGGVIGRAWACNNQRTVRI